MQVVKRSTERGMGSDHLAVFFRGLLIEVFLGIDAIIVVWLTGLIISGMF